MGDLEKFKRHMARPVDVEIENNDGEKDTFHFVPLSIEQFTEFMILSEKIDKAIRAAPEKDKKTIEQQEGVKLMFELYVRVVRSSYPEISEDDATSFVISNFTELMDSLSSLIPMKFNKGEQIEMSNKIAKMRKEMKNVGEDKPKDPE
jgi:hypothetical protein